MEYLPYPAHLGVPPLVVPYLVGFDFDHQRFETFPDRLGFIRDGRLDISRPIREIAAMAQAWLYFGLLEVVVGPTFDKNNMISYNVAGGATIDATSLHSLLDATEDREASLILTLTPAKVRETHLEIFKALTRASRASFELDEIDEFDETGSVVFLSVKILLHHLSLHFKQKWAVADNSGNLFQWSSLESLAVPSPVLRCEPDAEEALPARLLRDRMQRNGWCVHQIKDLFLRETYQLIYFLSSIPRAEPPEITHDDCTDTQCTAYNTKNETYSTQHVEATCSCVFWESPEIQVTRIVRDGGIPLISIKIDEHDRLELSVVAYNGLSRYTAISHLWVDGLGNPSKNALPICQLRKLAVYLRDMRNTRPISSRSIFEKVTRAPLLMWIDTLCIPLDEQLRASAIHQMAWIYASARDVLVLDHELGRIRWETEPIALASARIYASRWNRRCWTFQEGALTNTLYFQFQSSALLINRRVNWPMESNQLIRILSGLGSFILHRIFMAPKSNPRGLYLLHRTLFHNEVFTHAKWRKGRGPYQDMSLTGDLRRFILVWNEIGRRTTTQPNDIHAIIANLAGINWAQLMKIDNSTDRIKAILYLFDELPLELLYTPCFRPRQNEDCADRWIPNAPGSQPLLKHYPSMKYTARGFEVKSQVEGQDVDIFVVNLPHVDSSFCFEYKQSSHARYWYLVTCQMPRNDKLSRNGCTSYYFIIEKLKAIGDYRGFHKVRGARLVQRSHESTSTDEIMTRFDCPITARINFLPPSQKELTIFKQIQADKVPAGVGLIIEQGTLSSTLMKRRDKSILLI